MPSTFTGFPREAFSFWKGLEKNNNREWFQAHRETYEHGCREPLQALIAELAPRYGPGGKISRINRDMRFVRDKPYKNYIATKVAGNYVSLSQQGLWVGTGIYKPDAPTLRRLRAAIADDSSGRELETVITSLRRKGFTVDTHARLASTPRGYDAAHPRADLLRMKDLFAGKLFEPSDLDSPKVAERVVKAMTDVEPMQRWLKRHV